MMCRLFGLHAGHEEAKATFWLLQAPNSLSRQSHYEPDGTGIGTFDKQGKALIEKEPLTAWKDQDFATEARELESTTFLAHVRYATSGGHSAVNTHPFQQDNRIFAHNGVLGGLKELEQRLEYRGTKDLVEGETDSERMFALITAEIRHADDDVTVGITQAVNWIAENLPVYSLNLILTTASDLWALRYPESHDLFVLDRQPDAATHAEALSVHSQRIRAHSPALTHRHAVVVSTEEMTSDPGWRLMEPGELLHVSADLAIYTHIAFPQQPRMQIMYEQLSRADAAAQHPETEH